MWPEQEYRIEVRLLSETIFNSGEKERNLVQARALTDSYGFVYFHAKTLKGQLKKQAFWLLEQYKKINMRQAEDFFRSIVRLFGINKEELELHFFELKDIYQQQGIMKLGHLELDKRIRKYLSSLQLQDKEEEYYNISPHDLIEAQTHIRTGIQLEDEIIKDKMMTTYHTVKQNLIFYAKISFDEEPTKVNLENLQRITYSFHRIGSGIHRGRGEIKTRLLIDGQESPKQFWKEQLNQGGRDCASI